MPQVPVAIDSGVQHPARSVGTMSAGQEAVVGAGGHTPSTNGRGQAQLWHSPTRQR